MLDEPRGEIDEEEAAARAGREAAEAAVYRFRHQKKASRDLDAGDETIGVSTDTGDIEVRAEFFRPGHECDKLELPPGGWMTAFAFGYTLTVHLAQGSEWDKVLLIDESAAFRDNRSRWLYTAATRAKNRLVIMRGSP
jgi:hypothetical protein